MKRTSIFVIVPVIFAMFASSSTFAQSHGRPATLVNCPPEECERYKDVLIEKCRERIGAQKQKIPQTLPSGIVCLCNCPASETPRPPTQMSRTGQKTIAITIDDLPILGASKHSSDEQAAIFHAVVSALERHGVRATGFVVGKNIKPFHKDLLTEFISKGNTIGNHTYSHLSPNKVPIPEYLADISAGQKAIEEWTKGSKFFRFPFLQEGWTEKDHSQIIEYLNRNDYVIAQVTIDNDDWAYNSDYVDALKKNDQEKARDIGANYLAHMKKMTAHYEQRAKEVAGRPIRHVLLLHMSKINADYLDRLLAYYKEAGYSFIPLSQALEDPIYKWKDLYRGIHGISWLDRDIEPDRTAQ